VKTQATHPRQRSTADPVTNVRCMECSKVCAVVPTGYRIAMSKDKALSRIVGVCECGTKFSFPTTEESE